MARRAYQNSVNQGHGPNFISDFRGGGISKAEILTNCGFRRALISIWIAALSESLSLAGAPSTLHRVAYTYALHTSSMSDAKAAARNTGTLGTAFTFGSVAAVSYPVFLAFISSSPPQGSDAGHDFVGYSTDKLVGMARAACPMFLAFAFMHITLSCTMRRTLGRWQMKDGRDGAEVVAYNATVLVFDLIAVAVGIQVGVAARLPRCCP